MKIDLNKLYVVYKPTEHSEMVDVFENRPNSLEDLFSQVRGGLTFDKVHAIYTTKDGAKREAEKVFAEKPQGGEESERTRFSKFTKELAKLSSKYGIAIQSTGGVYYFDKPIRITYRDDPTSGDLDPSWDEDKV